MSLENSRIHRNLDAHIKILGLELYDLIIVLLLSAVMNLLFGQSSFVFVAVFVFPLFVLSILYVLKKGKPENYLIHLM